MSYTRIFECKSENDTKNLAVRFADIAKKGDVFALYGTLGVGKSFFSRHFIQHLTDVLDVPSPTFTLVQCYEAVNFEIFHYDMYRLKSPDEAYELGIEESFFNGVNLVEWPEKIQSLLPRNIWKITIDIKDNIRIFNIEVSDNEKQARLESI
ncbi:MAG: tRNA (adenosine(37)-N6)-threonylcarbamoyltransferase complex ATPase subunit type 1 TsaE [Alphaproteobacteria bacterium]|nr:tRNA (adenosine(37)-N6)-threonylcarbamoyltransferase complex ATPase subunit type 1 TsaE [Alphaproteobacteria bacterium]